MHMLLQEQQTTETQTTSTSTNSDKNNVSTSSNDRSSWSHRLQVQGQNANKMEIETTKKKHVQSPMNQHMTLFLPMDWGCSLALFISQCPYREVCVQTHTHTCPWHVCEKKESKVVCVCVCAFLAILLEEQNTHTHTHKISCMCTYTRNSKTVCGNNLWWHCYSFTSAAL